MMLTHWRAKIKFTKSLQFQITPHLNSYQVYAIL